MQIIDKWGVPNGFDFLSLSFTRTAEDVRKARAVLDKRGPLSQARL
jgi:pyruvate kinase